MQWTSTLDGRTSAVCRARDGKLIPMAEKNIPAGRALIPAGARPPAHPSCRSVLIAIFDLDSIEEALPDRPFVRDPRTRRQREIDFRAHAREEAGSERWRRMTPAQRNARRRSIRQEWVAENIGSVPATVDYNTWLSRQPVSFQEEVLGVAKARLFRQGDLRLDQFVDRTGNELTLAQLRETHPEAFEAAGL